MITGADALRAVRAQLTAALTLVDLTLETLELAEEEDPDEPQPPATMGQDPD